MHMHTIHTIHTYTYIYMHTRTDTCNDVGRYTCVLIHLRYTHIHTDTCTYIHIHTHTYTYIPPTIIGVLRCFCGRTRLIFAEPPTQISSDGLRMGSPSNICAWGANGRRRGAALSPPTRAARTGAPKGGCKWVPDCGIKRRVWCPGVSWWGLRAAAPSGDILGLL